MKAQDRRKIYVSSLEAHVDALHTQLLERKMYPVSFERLQKIHGVRSKTVVVSERFIFTVKPSRSLDSDIGSVSVHDWWHWPRRPEDQGQVGGTPTRCMSPSYHIELSSPFRKGEVFLMSLPSARF